MRIGVDIDDTLVDTSKRIIEYVTQHLGMTDEKEIIKEIGPVLQSDFQDAKSVNFVKEHFKQIAESALVKDNAIEVLNRLKEKHEIYIITARSNEMIKSIDLTINYLRDYKIPHDMLITRAFNKVDDCLEHGIDIMIDDKVSTIESVKSAGVETLLFTSVMNKDMNTTSRRVSNWLELEEYIKELENNQ